MKEKKNLKKAVEGDPISPFVIACELYNILNKLINSDDDLSEIETSGFIDFLLVGEEVNEGIRLLIKYKELFKS